MSNSGSIQPLVSVVLCTYNGEKFLRPQIDSITAQTYPNLEIIIIDDASSDSTSSILEEYRQKDSRVKFHINSANIGYNKNFEKAFSLATADYIAISDQDDIWESNKIELMMKDWLPGSLFIYSLSGNFFSNDFENRKQAPPVKYGTVTQLHQLVFSSPVHGHACMFKKELLSHCIPFPADIYYDWWMSMQAVRIAPVGRIPLTLTWHRVHETNSSRTILSIADKKERNRQLRRQFIYNIETFFHNSAVTTEDEKFLTGYTELLKKMDGERFSSAMFFYIMQHRRKIFHYKKNKPFIFISHLKHALRMAKTGVL
ncbi:MAG: glycosyltransferase [Chitinophagaceae bacterium]